LPTNSSLSGNQNLSRVIALPENRRLFYCHLRDIIDKACNTSYMTYWAGHYGSLAGKSYSTLLSWLGQRSAYVLQQLPPEIPFRITTQNGQSFVTDQTSIVLEGEAWYNVKAIVLSDAEPRTLDLTWTTITHWQARLDLHTGDNDLVLLAFDIDGNLLATGEITVTSSADPQFIRGDANGDAKVDLSDALRVLLNLFAGAPLSCKDAADVNGDEALDLADPIYLLEFLFRNGQPPPAPFPSRGLDPPPAGALDCGLGI